MFFLTGFDPSYTECKPHIDATIRELAAQALRSGESPVVHAEDGRDSNLYKLSDLINSYNQKQLYKSKKNNSKIKSCY